MDHDEVRVLLPRYASAELDLAEAAVVRAHLSECGDCLRDVFHRPAPPVAIRPPDVGPDRRRYGIPTAAGVALILFSLAGWSISRRATETQDAYEEIERARLSARVGRLKRELEVARTATRAPVPSDDPAPAPPVASAVPTNAPAPAFRIRYSNDGLSVSASDVPLRDVLDEIARQAGAIVRGEPNVDGRVSADFEDVPLPEALDRLLGGRNFVLVYDQSHRLRVVQLFGAPPASEAVASAAPVESPAARTARSVEAALGLLDRHPAALLQGKLADTLGEDTMPLRRLLQVGLQHPYRTTRERVMRRFLSEVESDADLDAAVLGSLADVDDGSLGDLVQRIAGDRAEEMLFYVATQASGELRSRAAAVLEKLRLGAEEQLG